MRDGVSRAERRDRKKRRPMPQHSKSTLTAVANAILKRAASVARKKKGRRK